MLVLADESCDAAVLNALRAAGHDVKAVAEALRGATDQAVLELAIAERRVVITKDKDFGELVFAGSTPVAVILLRFPPVLRARLPQALVDLVAARAQGLLNSFTVLTPAGARTARLP